MSGKDNKELKNTALADSRLPTVAIKPLVFGHHAAYNETGIDFTSLTWGSQDTIDTGITNPAASEILNAHLLLYGKGLSIFSSDRGPVWQKFYRLTSTGIVWQNFTTNADEIFIVTCNNTWRTSLQCVDADILNATGTLAANATEIDFVKVIKLPRTGQPCPILVQVDESTMYMNTNNSTSNLDGDFYIKDIGNGFGRSIVMNSSASVIRNYQITGAGVIPQSAEASVMQKIETLYSAYETLAADMARETGNPLSRYFTAPNSVDLNYFGDLVRSAQNSIAILQQYQKQSVVIKDVKPNATEGGVATAGSWQQRDLNTIENPLGFSWVSISSNQITLSTGVYEIDFSVPAFRTNGNRARLQNITDGVTSILGCNNHPGTSASDSSRILGIISVTGSKTFQIQHYFETTRSPEGLGSQNPLDGLSEVYTVGKITRVGV